MEKFQQRQGELRDQMESLEAEIEKLKQARKATAHHIAVKSLPEEDRFTRLRTERKHFVDTIKMIAYRAETSLASLLKEHLARASDDARALVRQIFEIAADLIPRLHGEHPDRASPPLHPGGSRRGHRKTLGGTQ